MNKPKDKRPVGRPPLMKGAEQERFTVTLPPALAKKLRERGAGSLSLGIIEAARHV